MDREIKFKGKLQNYYGVIDKEWITFELFDIFNYNDSLSKTIVSEPLCELITTINDVEIYEYDCWWDKQFPKFFHYFFYNNYGILEKRLIFINRMADFNKKQNGFKIVQVEQIQNNTNSIYIGNWHDGEEYLLNKIKEVENE